MLNTLRKACLITTTIVAISAPAVAADLPSKQAPISMLDAPPVFSWSGFYAGVNVGYGHLRTATTHNGDSAGFGESGIGSGASSGKQENSASGALGGVQFGFNHQFGSLVAGVEADMALSSLRGNSTLSGMTSISSTEAGSGSGASSLTLKNSMSAFGTLRGRFGIAVNRALFYVTGGLAYARVNTSATYSVDNSPIYTQSVTAVNNGWRVGWTAGIGSEYAISPNWSMKVEALYFDLGKKSFDASANTSTKDLDAGTTLSGNSRNTGLIARIGLNYRIGSDNSAVLARY